MGVPVCASGHQVLPIPLCLLWRLLRQISLLFFGSTEMQGVMIYWRRISGYIINRYDVF
jgi:hypothetical protein